MTKPAPCRIAFRPDFSETAGAEQNLAAECGRRGSGRLRGHAAGGGHRAGRKNGFTRCSKRARHCCGGGEQTFSRRHRRRLPSAVARGQAQRDHVRGRPSRLRQDHAAALHRRPDRCQQRQASGPRQAGGRTAARRRRHGVPAFRAAAVEDGLRQRRLRSGDGGRLARSIKRAGRALSRTGRPHRLRAALSLSALRRHAAARRPGARARHEPVDPADGRAVRRARRADARNPAGGAACAHGAARTSARPWCSSPIRSTRRSCSATASR